ncbi:MULTISPECIES: iron-siderophore ABC transporter substrate-binding protein [unclassified Halomonas]|uniref:ABC transporter substrate-binding protein n=1 Tax=unclassified Halomonas TaxID=2609666 RepID=UPI0007D9AC73|nr:MULTISPECIES: iron-siderophore ABC transporter substrate-binding protein [unclassified Halomonas]MBT2785184.1 iron-siderophore ABC transporter substrate-binding protein [Halomonas sp. ISL-106]MBT2796878.1 iron-siderophore ABC transporter substrate-binding protein [Halomonas sp. ISL-104]OAL60100.1 iron ABC transporter substrate-binding protein [Halomonas sp. ALS9]
MLKAHTHGKKVLMRVLLITLAALTPAMLTANPLHSPPDSPRIVTLYQGATDSAVALGLTPIGVVDSWLEKPMYRYLRDPLDGVEHVGLETQPNLEKIAWLKPDLVIASNFRHARIAPLLSAIAPTVSAPTVFNFKTTLTMVANATHQEAEAGELLQRWDERVADFRQQIAVKLGDAWPQKVAVVRFKSDHVRIYTSGFAGSILDELGFAQPDTLQSQSWGMKLSSTENIPVLDADALFILLEPDDPAIADNYRHWASHPLWQQLSAVQSGRVFEVDPVSWMMGGGILAANAMLDDLYSHYELTCHTPLPNRGEEPSC